VLFLKKGRPHFAIRTNGAISSVYGKQEVKIGRWTHLVGVLTAEKELRIYVDGKRAGAAPARNLIASEPAEPLNIGADEGSTVGDYASPFTMAGVIDEVRIYNRALDDNEIQKLFENGEYDRESAVLAMSFEEGKARDLSGNNNNGTIEGATFVKGQTGQALQFTGGGRRSVEFTVDHHWTQKLPIFARAMLLADNTLFVAGPPDTLDEEEAFRTINDPETQAKLEDYADAFSGKKGATLCVASADTGETIADYKLEAPPVFDGLAAAEKRLYLTLTNGNVVCMSRD